MKKILYAINFINNGGPSRVLLNQINSIDTKKYDIYVLTIIDENDTTIISNLKNKGVKVVEFPLKKKIFDVIKFYRKIINKVNEINPDIIHTHGIVTSIILSTKKISSKKITTIHNSIIDDYIFKYGNTKGHFIAKVHIACLKRFDNVICCSKTSYLDNKKYFKNNYSYIRNGIAIDNENPKEKRTNIRKELNIPENSLVYIYCGVLTNRKNVSQLVNYYERYLKDNEYLLILGDGEERKKLEESTKKSNIIFLGYKNNVLDYYSASDIYTSFSLSEGFSISIIEALSCGLALFLYDIPSHRECFELEKDTYIGELFDEINFAEKKENIEKKFKNTNNINIYKKYLTASVMTKEYEKIYDK